MSDRPQMTDEQFEGMVKTINEAREAMLKLVNNLYTEGIAALDAPPVQRVRVLTAEALEQSTGCLVAPGTTPQVLPGRVSWMPARHYGEPPKEQTGDVRICFIEQVEDRSHILTQWQELQHILSTDLTQRITVEAFSARDEAYKTCKQLADLKSELTALRETTEQAKHKAERARAECDALSSRLFTAEKKLKTLRADVGERRAKELLGETE